MLFANFAEAMAEARGKAQADSLRKTKSDSMARRYVNGGNKLPTRAEVLREVAATKDLATPIGKIGFDAGGDTTHPALSLYKVSGGKAQVASLIELPR